MAGAKLVVLYPSPRDVKAFERAYTDGSAPPFYRIAELHFPSMEALQVAAACAPAQKAVAHAVSISTGGKPLFLVAEEEAKTF